MTLPHPIPQPAPSPLSLTESVHGSEPGSKLLLRSNAVIVAGRLQQLDLGNDFELLDQQTTGAGPMRVGQVLTTSGLICLPLTPTQGASVFTGDGPGCHHPKIPFYRIASEECTKYHHKSTQGWNPCLAQSMSPSPC